MRKKGIVIFLFFAFIIGGVILGKAVSNHRVAEKKVERSSSKSSISSTSSRAKSSSKEEVQVYTSESFVPTEEQKEEVRIVDEVGDDEIFKGREELKAAGYNPTDFSGVDMARYIKKAKNDGKTLVDAVKSDGVEP